MAVAGLWESYVAPAGDIIRTYCIITVEAAGGAVAAIHDGCRWFWRKRTGPCGWARCRAIRPRCCIPCRWCAHYPGDWGKAIWRAPMITP
jgi:hypothetical protein